MAVSSFRELVRRGLVALATGAIGAMTAAPVAAHGPAPAEPPTAASLLLGWTFEPLPTLGIVAAGAWWTWAVRRVGAANPGKPVPRRRTLAFLGALAALAVALLSGIDRYDTTLFSVHMVQHLLLALVAAPRGYRLACVMPEKMCVDKRVSLVALGAEVRIECGAGTACYFRDEDFAVAECAAEIGRERGVSGSQIALAWILSKPYVSSPIIGATKMDHLEQAIAALEAPREKVHNEAFNVGRTEHNYRIRDIAQIVAEVVPGCRLEFAPDAGPDTRSYRVSFEKLARVLPARRRDDVEPDRAGPRELDEVRRVRRLHGIFERRHGGDLHHAAPDRAPG